MIVLIVTHYVNTDKNVKLTAEHVSDESSSTSFRFPAGGDASKPTPHLQVSDLVHLLFTETQHELLKHFEESHRINTFDRLMRKKNFRFTQTDHIRMDTSSHIVQLLCLFVL